LLVLVLSTLSSVISSSLSPTSLLSLLSGTSTTLSLSLPFVPFVGTGLSFSVGFCVGVDLDFPLPLDFGILSAGFYVSVIVNLMISTTHLGGIFVGLAVDRGNE
jgi:hypothetical protein